MIFSPTKTAVLVCVATVVPLGVPLNHSALSQSPAADSVTQRLRLAYENGFMHVVSGVPDSQRAPEYWPLSALARFKSLNVRWARLEGRAYLALERGHRAAGWIAIVPPGNEALNSISDVLALDPNPELNVITIKPADVSEPWAGIFLVNALSHLADRIARVTPPAATAAQALLSQFRAYNLELMAADVLSNGAIRETLDSVLTLANEPSLRQLAADAPKLAAANLVLLSSAITGGDPRSPDEAKLRTGFFAVALLLRQGQRQSLGLDTVLQAIDQVGRAVGGR